MLTLKLINEETERVIKGLKKKHFENAEDAIAEVIETGAGAKPSRNWTVIFLRQKNCLHASEC